MDPPDIDLITDSQSPILQNLEINRQRLGIILDRTIEKIELACCLDDFVANNGKLLEPYLNPTDFNFVLDTYKKVPFCDMEQNRSIQISLRGHHHKQNRSKRDCIVMAGIQRDVQLSEVISTLHHHNNIRMLAKELLNNRPEQSFMFLIHIRSLKEIILKKLYETATEERLYEKNIGQLWKKTAQWNKKIGELENVRDKKIFELNALVAEKHRMVESQKNKIAKMNVKCIEDIQNIVNNSERSMARTAIGSEERIVELEETARTVTSNYHQLLEKHLAHEKQLRIKRSKVETALANVLAKYDADIGELQSQLEVLQDGFNKEKEQLDDLKQRFEEQEVRYVELMTEKAEEERKIWEGKLFQFICNRSARRIQRWWRPICKRIWKYRAKFKKGKGKAKK